MTSLERRGASCCGPLTMFFLVRQKRFWENGNEKLAIMTAFALLGGAALAETPSEKIGVSSALGIAPTTQDFVTEAASVGQFEIQSSQLAQDRAPDQSTKSFAQQMITDHQKLGSELKDLVKSKAINVTIPDAMGSSDQSTFDELKTLNGADFDKQYRDDQYSGHKSVVNLFRRYAKGGENADLKQRAQQTAPMLEHHLQMAHDLDKQATK
jgi:putative membrane protein